MTPEQKAEQKWNAQADQFNQWPNLSDEEKSELIEKEKPMNCPNCKRPVATEDDYKNIPAGEGSNLCWMMWGDDYCQRASQAIRESALSTIEILQAAIDEGCAIEIDKHSGGSIYCEIDGEFVEGWANETTIQEAIAAACNNYQTNKNQ